MTTTIVGKRSEYHGNNGSTYATLEERYWSKVDVRGEDECWPWNASRNKKGYGLFDARIATRKGWELVHGEYPPLDIFVCHTCDNPPCQNPKHWFLGTNEDNMADRQRKGRQARGEKIIHAKLTRRQVVAIRREYRRDPYWGKQKELREKYGVSSGTISQIINRKLWV